MGAYTETRTRGDIGMEKFFKLRERGTSVKTELIAGVTTFLAIVIMSQKKIRDSVLIGILGGMGLYYLLGFAVDGFYAGMEIHLSIRLRHLANSMTSRS